MKQLIAKTLLLISLVVMPWLQATNAWYLDAERSEGNRFGASSLDFDLVDQNDAIYAGLFFDTAKFTTEQTLTKSITVTNMGQMDISYWPRFEFVFASQLACEPIEISARLNGNQVYQGSLTGFNLAASPTLLSQTDHQWEFSLTHDNQDAGLNGQTCEFNLVFAGFQNPETQQGFSDTEFLTNKVTLAHQPTLTAEYDQDDHRFKFTLEHLTSFVTYDYELTYDTDTISDMATGSESIDDTDPITKTILLGTCSNEDSCTYLPNPHNFKLSLTLTDNDGDQLELSKEL